MENLWNIWKVEGIVVNNMKEEFDIDNLIQNMDFNSGKYQEVKRGIFLTNREIEVLKRYHIPYENCHNLKEIIFLVEDIIDSMDIIDEDLDSISKSISERDYYENTNK